jgi:small subunit ribosomal protein S10
VIHMAQQARIKLASTDLEKLEQMCKEIKMIGDKTGVRVRGPIPLPTKRLHVVTRKAPSGQGTHTFDKWEMRVHRRIIDIAADDRAMKQLMRLKIPDEVVIEVILQ